MASASRAFLIYHADRGRATFDRVGTVVDDVSAARAVAERMAEAARAWLDTLDPEQRAVAVGAVPADDPTDGERRRWFYTPTDHGGLTVHAQRPAQQRAAMRLVGSGLSAAGYVTVATTMGLENILDHAEGFVTRFDRERGRDPGLYYLRVFGEPGGSGAVGLALRRPPRVAEQPRRRRRAGRDDAVLHGRRPRRVAAARRRGEPPARPRRGPGPRPRPVARSPSWPPGRSCSPTRRRTS